MESPPKARSPDTISYSTAPKLKISERSSSGLPCACSGAMYAAVPITVPSMVSVRSELGESAKLSQTKIEQFHHPLCRNQDIGGFQVTVQNSPPVRLFESTCNLKR